MGLDLKTLLAEAMKMESACGRSVPLVENPALLLGVVMGEMARMGRDKVTFLLSDSMGTLGTWLEQLIAESTGKDETGLLPVTGETIGNPLVYGADRLFVYLSRKGRKEARIEEGIRRLQEANLPVVFIELSGTSPICQEFYRWEVATAVSGSILGINPFDQPNVQEAKDATNRLLRSVQERGSLTEPAPVACHGPFSFFARDGGDSPEERAIPPLSGPAGRLRRAAGLCTGEPGE